jgi:hypothetical protein
MLCSLLHGWTSVTPAVFDGSYSLVRIAPRGCDSWPTRTGRQSAAKPIAPRLPAVAYRVLGRPARPKTQEQEPWLHRRAADTTALDERTGVADDRGCPPIPQPAPRAAVASSTVDRAIPDVRATAAIPPRPSARACAPASRRRCRSSRCGDTTANITASASSVTSIPRTPHHPSNSAPSPNRPRLPRALRCHAPIVQARLMVFVGRITTLRAVVLGRGAFAPGSGRAPSGVAGRRRVWVSGGRTGSRGVAGALSVSRGPPGRVGAGAPGRRPPRSRRSSRA